ncbi:aminotransferase class I/II-fold pyridoxal phosphate-dependent enzyme [Flavobacteriaceae bacterium M23B6Z8]
MNQKSFSKQDALISKIVRLGIDSEVGHLSCEDKHFNGRDLTLNGRKMLNFASCSYLGLALDQRLKEGACEGLERYGNSFPTSRSFISMGYLDRLEKELENLIGYPCLVTTSTSLGHVAWLPLLVGANDLVILDHQVHNSVSTAAQLLKAKGCKLEVIRHNRMDILEERISLLKDQYDHIWYLADGIYSMYGDLAPVNELHRLLDDYENFHVYLDDAHGMSWKGDRGVGHVLKEHKLHDRMALITSLGKSFGSLGGVLIFGNEEKKLETKIHAGPLIFSSPMVPAVIGASLASVAIHMSDELPELQQKLVNKIDYFKTRAIELGMPLLGTGDTPIFFVPIGDPEDVFVITHDLMSKGYYQSPSVFPSVPVKNAGLRFTITNWLLKEDIDNMLQQLSKSYRSHLSPDKRDISLMQKRFKGTLMQATLKS